MQRTALTVSRDKEAFLEIGVASSMVPVLKYLTAEVTITHYISLACLKSQVQYGTVFIYLFHAL